MPRLGTDSLVALLRFRAEQQGDRRVFTFLGDGETESAHLTYAEFDCRVRALAAQIKAVGATGERALLLYTSGLDLVTAFFGCFYAGDVAVQDAALTTALAVRTLTRHAT